MKQYFANELPLNHEHSLNYWACSLADDDVETGECSNWDHAYESAWSYIDALIEEQRTLEAA